MSFNFNKRLERPCFVHEESLSKVWDKSCVHISAKANERWTVWFNTYCPVQPVSNWKAYRADSSLAFRWSCLPKCCSHTKTYSCPCYFTGDVSTANWQSLASQRTVTLGNSTPLHHASQALHVIFALTGTDRIWLWWLKYFTLMNCCLQ